MADVTVIGQGTRVRGRVSGAVDLEISGHLEGEVSIEGDLVVEGRGLVAANLAARRIVVRGAVKGDLSGTEAVVLEDGARVVGDVRAPRIAVNTGALVRGYVQAGAEGDDGRAASRSAGALRPAASTVAPSRAAAPAPRATAPATRPQAAPSRPAAPAAPAPAAAPEKKGPPPPVVPAIKKGARGAVNRRRAG
jgi:cytoskeletal protein CcmA (bactofilin family)